MNIVWLIHHSLTIVDQQGSVLSLHHACPNDEINEINYKLSKKVDLCSEVVHCSVTKSNVDHQTGLAVTWMMRQHCDGQVVQSVALQMDWSLWLCVNFHWYRGVTYAHGALLDHWPGLAEERQNKTTAIIRECIYAVKYEQCFAQSSCASPYLVKSKLNEWSHWKIIVIRVIIAHSMHGTLKRKDWDVYGDRMHTRSAVVMVSGRYTCCVPS